MSFDRNFSIAFIPMLFCLPVFGGPLLKQECDRARLPLPTPTQKASSPQSQLQEYESSFFDSISSVRPTFLQYKKRFLAICADGAKADLDAIYVEGTKAAKAFNSLGFDGSEYFLLARDRLASAIPLFHCLTEGSAAVCEVDSAIIPLGIDVGDPDYLFFSKEIVPIEGGEDYPWRGDTGDMFVGCTHYGTYNWARTLDTVDRAATKLRSPRLLARRDALEKALWGDLLKTKPCSCEAAGASADGLKKALRHMNGMTRAAKQVGPAINTALQSLDKGTVKILEQKKSMCGGGG